MHAVAKMLGLGGSGANHVEGIKNCSFWTANRGAMKTEDEVEMLVRIVSRRGGAAAAGVWLDNRGAMTEAEVKMLVRIVSRTGGAAAAGVWLDNRGAMTEAEVKMLVQIVSRTPSRGPGSRRHTTPLRRRGPPSPRCLWSRCSVKIACAHFCTFHTRTRV